MPKSAKRITLRDVAKKAGVSEMTVSRVLRGDGVVSLRTRDRVKSICDTMGYVQNQLAGSLAKSRSNQVAVIIPSMVNNVFTEVMSGISEELGRAGYSAVVGISDYNLETEETLVYSMMSWRPAGLIVPNVFHTERTENILRAADVPVVEIMNLTRNPIDISVGLDQRKAGAVLAKHVVSRGYRRFGVVGWHEDDFSAAARFSEIEKQVNESGFELTAPKLFNRPPNFSAGKEGLRQLLHAHPDLEAVFFSNDTAAIGGMVHCIEAGISIPDDLAIAGFSGLATGQSMPWKLTTISTNRFETGRIAARSILRRLSGGRVAAVRDMGFELIEGETV